MITRARKPAGESERSFRTQESQFASRPFAHRAEEHEGTTNCCEPRIDFSIADIDIFPRETVQPKLKLGPVGDRYEQEADQMVQIISSPNPDPVQRGGGCKEDNANLGERIKEGSQLRRKIAGFAPAAGDKRIEPDLKSAIQRTLSVGQPLSNVVSQPMEQAFITGQDIFLRQGENRPASSEGQMQATGRVLTVKKEVTPNRTGMPDNLKSGIENLSGMDLSGVRVHYNSANPAQFNALAYTQGQEIHVAPGQEKHLPHEGWHVVQQMQGRVKPTIQARGVAMNDDPDLEREADFMGAKATIKKSPDLFTVLRAEGARRATASVATQPIQCNLGIEIEVGGGEGWRVNWAKGSGPKVDEESESKPDYSSINRPVAKGVVIVDGEGFELQAETSGRESTIEFVTKPPGMRNESEVDHVMDNMVSLANKLSKKNKSKKRFNASKVGGNKSFDLTPGYNLTGSMQATVGVPLASVPALYRKLAAIGVQGDLDLAVKSATDSEKALQEITGSKPSGEVIGLLVLLRHYLALGNVKSERSFPKAVFGMMARTDFSTMFNMVPESKKLEEKLDQWVMLVLNGLIKQDAVLQQIFNYDETKQDPPFRITTTRGDWLMEMPKLDLLSSGGHSPKDVEVAVYSEPPKSLSDKGTIGKWVPADPDARMLIDRDFNPDKKVAQKLKQYIEDLFQGMGGYGSKTDAVRYLDDKEDTNAVLIEIREPPSAGIPKNWKDRVLDIHKVLVEAIAEPYGATNKKPAISVESKSQRKKRMELEGSLGLAKKNSSFKKKYKKKKWNEKESLKEYHPTINVNGTTLYANQTVGDGNCFFHAFYESQNNVRSDLGRQQDLRSRIILAFQQNAALAMSHFGPDGTGSPEFQEFATAILIEGNWASDQTPAMVADALATRIVIHYPNGAIYYDAQPNQRLCGPVQGTVHVQYTGNHYNSYTIAKL